MVLENFIETIQKSKTQASQTNGHDESLAEYEVPLVTVDIVVFTIQNQELKVLLIQRKKDPYEHMWAIPGGFLHVGEKLIEAAERRLHEETNVKDIYLEQLHAFATPGRDPRARVVTIAFFALICADQLKLEADANAEDVNWFPITKLPELAFDHQEIIEFGLLRLKDRLETSSIAFQLLPKKFTLTELQRVYELILEKSLDKRNFRKKILSSGILTDIGETKMDGYHRPAQLYAFNPLEPATVQ